MKPAATLKALAQPVSALLIIAPGLATAFISQSASPDYQKLLTGTALLLALTTLASIIHCYYFKGFKSLTFVVLAIAYLFFAEFTWRVYVQ